MFLLRPVLYILLTLAVAIAWPDGAPCVHAVYESMNPLEAVEHQGGLQLTVPPYKIEVREKCYWMNQPVELSLKGNTTEDRFRGFAIQPISYKGPNRGRRIGQFLRLDDNGSWQQQCFRFKNSVTHSHDEKKKNIKLWWKNEFSDDDYVQFVATVVKSQKEFWVKSIKSVPIPPCRYERNGIENYIPDPVTPPPPVKQFKLETFRMLDAVDEVLQHNLLEMVPNDEDRTPKPQKIQDVFKVVHISNQLHTKVPRPFTPATRALTFAPAPMTLPPPPPPTPPPPPSVPQPPPAFVTPFLPPAKPPQLQLQPQPRPPFAQPIPLPVTTPMPPAPPPQQAPTFAVQKVLQPQPSPPSPPAPPSVHVFVTVPTPPPELVPQAVPPTFRPQIVNNQVPTTVTPTYPPRLVDNQVQAPVMPVQPIRERQRLTHVIPVSNLVTVQPPASQQFQQAVVLTAQQQQPIRSEFLAPPHTPKINQRIFMRPAIHPQTVFRPANICADVNTAEFCFSRIAFCNTHQYMRMYCRRTCHFC